MGPESEEKKEMLIIDGNAFYEIDSGELDKIVDKYITAE